MSNSKYVEYTRMSPNCSERTAPISKITIHHMAVVNGSLEGVGARFADRNSYASANYAIDSDGRVALYVSESLRAWTSSSSSNDNVAVTIECANSKGNPNWEISDKCYAKLIDLCVDICERNGIKALNYTGDATGNLTRHNMFTQTVCPGPYLQSKFPAIAAEVNKRLQKTPETPEPVTLYRVQLGAFSKLSNAEKMLAQARAIVPDAFMVKYDDLYKVQVGAFRNMVNAEAMAKMFEAKGFSTFITTASGTQVTPTQSIAVGDTVKLADGAPDYDGRSLADFVYKRTYQVRQIDGKRAVITYAGTVVAAVNIDNLILFKKA